MNYKNILFQISDSVAEIKLNRSELLNSFNYEMADEFLDALNNSAPLLGVVGKRRGRSKILVPRPLTPKKRLGLALKWIVTGARARTELSMSERLAYELLSLSKGQGNAIRQKLALHQLVFKNRNNSYFKGR